jgi:hypothetical protein
MNAALPELRSAVMIVVEASWEDAAGVVHTARARMEDKSASGACLRLRTPVETGLRLRVQWRFEQFSGVVKYCRSEGAEFVIGMQRDKGVIAGQGRSAAAVANSASPQPNGSTRPREVQGSIGEVPALPQGQREAEKKADENMVAEVASVAVNHGVVRADGSTMERLSDNGERRRGVRMPLSEEKQGAARRDREICRQHEANEERKPMKRKWLDLTPWNHKQEGPSGGSNGSSGAVGKPEPMTGLGVSSLPANQMIDHENDSGPGFSTELLEVADVYLAAGVMQPRGRGVQKVIEMMRSEHIRGAAREMKRGAVLMALEAAGISVEQVHQDARSRQIALDAYEAEQKKQAEALWARKAEENGKIQADMERVQAHYMARIARNLEAVAEDQAVLRNWQTMKQEELQRLNEAVELCIKPVVAEATLAATTAVVSEPMIEKAHAAVAGGQGGGVIKRS